MITEAYQNLKAVKENLEIHLAGQLKTAAATFKSFKSLGSFNPSEILLNLASVVVPVLNPKKFSVYFIGPNGFEPATSYGWDTHEKYRRRFGTGDQLYQAILGGQKILSVVNPEDERILDGEGILAAPLIESETHEIFGMLKIEEMEFSDLSIGKLETFKTLCDLIGLSYTNARQYKKLQENTIASAETPFYTYNFYALQKKIFENIAKEATLPISQISLKFGYHPSENRSEPAFVSSVLYMLLKEILPETAMVFHGKRKWMDFIILLPSATLSEAEKIKEVLKESMENNDLLKMQSPSFAVEALIREGQ